MGLLVQTLTFLIKKLLEKGKPGKGSEKTDKARKSSLNSTELLSREKSQSITKSILYDLHMYICKALYCMIYICVGVKRSTV